LGHLPHYAASWAAGIERIKELSIATALKLRTRPNQTEQSGEIAEIDHAVGAAAFASGEAEVVGKITEAAWGTTVTWPDETEQSGEIAEIDHAVGAAAFASGEAEVVSNISKADNWIAQ